MPPVPASSGFACRVHVLNLPPPVDFLLWRITKLLFAGRPFGKYSRGGWMALWRAPIGQGRELAPLVCRAGLLRAADAFRPDREIVDPRLLPRRVLVLLPPDDQLVEHLGALPNVAWRHRLTVEARPLALLAALHGVDFGLSLTVEPQVRLVPDAVELPLPTYPLAGRDLLGRRSNGAVGVGSGVFSLGPAAAQQVLPVR